MRVIGWQHAAAGLATATLFVSVACNLDHPDSFGSFGGGRAPIPSTTSTTSEPVAACASAREGAACPTDEVASLGGLVCEVGDNANPACNTTLSCASTGTWKVAKRPTSSCPLACPSVRENDLPAGCANAPALICEFPEGTCGCTPLRPDAGDAGDADASDADANDAGTLTYTWHCVEPDAGCPHHRPRGGMPCVRPMVCDYGGDVFGAGFRMRCYSGGQPKYWVAD